MAFIKEKNESLQHGSKVIINHGGGGGGRSSRTKCRRHDHQVAAGSLNGPEVLEAVARPLKGVDIRPRILYTLKVSCPDEINHEEGDVTNIFTRYFHDVFHLGGLAGIPFTGKTGFSAFSHHVPHDGHCFVLMAPHVGLSSNGKLGKYVRDGQLGEEVSSACGAAVGAFHHCCEHEHLVSEDMHLPDNDYQMAYIIREIYKRKKI